MSGGKEGRKEVNNHAGKDFLRRKRDRKVSGSGCQLVVGSCRWRGSE